MTEHFILHDPNGPDLEFDGELLLKDNYHDTGLVEIYRPAMGRIVLKQHLSVRPGIILVNEVRLCETLDAALSTLGFGPGAKDIGRKLHVYETRRID